MFTAAVVQEPPVYLDLEASMARAVDELQKAAKAGAKLVVFPEAWFPGYPTFVWRLKPGAEMGKADELFTRLLDNAVDLSRDALKPLRDAAAEAGVVVVAGVQERDGVVSGSTVYNTAVVIDADGRLSLRQVRPGNRYGDRIEILAGLDANETVALDPVRAGIEHKRQLEAAR